jgi:O-antigen/teichoic acid export membrane protein
VREMVIAMIKAGAGNLVGLVLGSISIKILAVIMGPPGVGLFSLLRNLQQVLSTIGSVGGHNAIVQVLPSLHGRQREQYVASVFWVCIGVTMLVALLAIFFADTIALVLMGVEQAYLIRLLAVPTALGVMLFYFRAILNAHLEIGDVAWVNISVGLASVLAALSAALDSDHSRPYAMLGMLAFPLAIGAALAFARARERRFLVGVVSLSIELFEWTAAKQFIRLALPSLLAALISMASVLLIRSMVVKHHGLGGAGYFDAGWAISAMYLALFLSAMQTYLLPAMSGESEGGALRELLDKALRLATIAVVPLIVFVIVFKPFLAKVLYSSEFSPALDLLRWTLLGDYLRVSGWLLATYLLARVDMAAYLVHELVWSCVFVIVGVWLLPDGLEGVGKAYLVAYTAYLLTLLWRIRVSHRVRLHWRAVAVWAAGWSVVLVASLLTWNTLALDWKGVSSLVCSMLFSWMVLKPNERLYLRRLLLNRFDFGK